MEDHKRGMSRESPPFMKDKAVKKEYLKRLCPVTDCKHFESMPKGQMAAHYAMHHPAVPIRFVQRGRLYKLIVNSSILPDRTYCFSVLKIRFNRNFQYPALFLMCTTFSKFSRNARNEDIPATCIWLLTEETKQPVHAILGYKGSEIKCRAYTLEELDDAMKDRNLYGIVLNREEAIQFICNYNPEITFKLP